MYGIFMNFCTTCKWSLLRRFPECIEPVQRGVAYSNKNGDLIWKSNMYMNIEIHGATEILILSASHKNAETD